MHAARNSENGITKRRHHDMRNRLFFSAIQNASLSSSSRRKLSNPR
jgi:hypothetical protein